LCETFFIEHVLYGDIDVQLYGLAEVLDFNRYMLYTISIGCVWYTIMVS